MIVAQVGFVGAKKNEARLMDATTSVTIGRYTDERALYSLDFSHNDALMVQLFVFVFVCLVFWRGRLTMHRDHARASI